ncbi:MAG: hypothetical protein QOD78_654 [Chloroflexota bacterium]|nr:hypothetical protein [Chloroflexota bacterium]
MTSGGRDDGWAGEMTAADELARAVRAWLEGLDAGQRATATFPFAGPERFAWDYRPGDRGGLALADMRPDQRAAALSVVATAMSARGADEVAAIIALEPILGALERETGRSRFERDPELFWFSVFGDPHAGAPWSWRIGGHHVAVQLTVADGHIVGSAPSFLGANPAVIPSGPRAGARALTGEETFARELLAALSPDQRAVVIVDPKAPPDIHSGNGARADVRAIPSGIRHDDLTLPQQAALETLIRHYLGRARIDVAAAEWERIADAGLAEITFAWAGPVEPRRGHYYAVRGPGFLVEYDNTQDGANHIHAVWRDLTNDWGEDALAAHYRLGHAAAG